jgi:hypothetical protein
MLDVGGMAEPGSAVYVDGVEGRTRWNTFTAVARLSEGENLVTATAVDLAGNQNWSSIIVRLDTVPPALGVEFLPDAASVRNSQIGIRGTMETGAALTVNGRRVVLPGISDNFTTLFFLRPGSNTIRVEATDAAGNVNSVVRQIVLDTVPPAFRVNYPPDGLLTRERSLGIELWVEAGTVLSVGNSSQEVPGPTGQMVNMSVTYALQEGTNDILLGCRDAAENVFVQGRAVRLDTIPPGLELQSPGDGSRTPADSVYIVGRSEPGAVVSVNGGRLEVGLGGSFSSELPLGAGRNRIVLRATDAAGNVFELSVNVTRIPALGGTTVVGILGPDFAFILFLATSTGIIAGEGAWAIRRLKRPGDFGRGRDERGAGGSQREGAA